MLPVFHIRKVKITNNQPQYFGASSQLLGGKVLLAIATVFLLLIFALFTAYHGDFLVSGKGDDGYFWSAVFSSEIKGFESLYPNIAFLRFLHYVGFDFTSLYVTNLLLQITLLLLLLNLISKRCERNTFVCFWIFLWVTTTFELLFATIFLMRDLYVLLFILLASGSSKHSSVKLIALSTLALLRPFALLLMVLFAQTKKIIIVMIVIVIIFTTGLTNVAIKSILMPNAVFIGSQFNIEDVISARAARNLEGQKKIKGSFLSQLLSPVLMIVRPLVINQPNNEYLAHNGLADTIEHRRNSDPYVMWQNIIVPINCIYASFLLIALFRGLMDNIGNQRKNVTIYLVGTVIIAIISGQGRHHLMINWLEPIIIAHAFVKDDIIKVAVVLCATLLISIYFAISLLL